MPPLVPTVIMGVFGLFGALIVLAGAGQLKSWNRLKSMSAGAVTGKGVVEVEGTARPLHETLTSPHWNADSLAFEYEHEERRHDHDMDDGGSEWHTEKSITDSVPFVIDSSSGDVVVDPDGANLLFEQQRERNGRTRHTARRLDVDEDVYVAGEAIPAHESNVDADGHKYVVTRTDSTVSGSLGSLFGSPFVLSDSGEDEAERRLLKRGLMSIFVGLIVLGMIGVMATGFFG
jgi:hypothetical protein